MVNVWFVEELSTVIFISGSKIEGNYKRPESKFAVWGIGVVSKG